MSLLSKKRRPRVTPTRALPPPLTAIPLAPEQLRRAHMLASLLLDYPDARLWERQELLRAEAAALPGPVAEPLTRFLDHLVGVGLTQAQRDYVTTFDLKRRCSLYLSYYATGDTRRRGTALVTFLEAYRAAGYAPAEDELPDFLPAVLEFSAVSGDEVALALLAAHQEGVEVLRAALESMDSPWADVVRVVTLTLPPVDEATRERVLDLVNEGPPTETVGLSFLGNLPPYRAREDQ